MSTKIEWTDETWNPVTGCTKVSEGCDHCYIERTPPFRMEGRKFLPLAGPEAGKTTGVRLHPERLDQPLHWRKPRRVFVNSLSDLFHADVPDAYIARVWAAMALGPQHTFQVLTKRPARMRALISSSDFQAAVDDAWMTFPGPEGPGDMGYPSETWPLPNVWLGVSVENQKWADIRIPALMETPAAGRFLSCEPLLGPVRLTHLHSHCPTHDFAGGFCSGPCPDRRWPDWVIVGGESGPNARPMDPAWVEDIRDQCVRAGVAFFFKQWGGRTPKANGRELDGRTWDEYPAVTP